MPKPIIIAITGMPASGKSLDGNEKVLIVGENGLIREEKIKDIEHCDEEIRTFCFNRATLKVELKDVTHFIKHKLDKPLLEVKTSSGRAIKVTRDHSLFTLKRGRVSEIKTEDLKVGDFIPISKALPYEKSIEEIDLLELFKDEERIYVHNVKPLVKGLRKKLGIKLTNRVEDAWLNAQINPSIKKFNWLLNKANFDRSELPESICIGTIGQTKTYPAKLKIDKNLMKFLGYFIAEGWIENRHAMKISNTNPRIQQDILDSLEAMGYSSKVYRGKEIRIFSSILIKILNEFFDIDVPSSSKTKKIPPLLYSLPKEKISAFISAYLEGDGYANQSKGEVEASSASKELARGIAILLTKFNIVARFSKDFKRATNSSHKGDFYHRIRIAGKHNMQKMIENDLLGPRLKAQISGYMNKQSTFHTNIDLVPAGDFLKEIRMEQGIFQRDLHHQYNLSKYENEIRHPSRMTLQNILSALLLLVPAQNLKVNRLKNLANSDLFWDRVTEIKDVKSSSEYVYDLSVKDAENFLSFSGIFLHNSTCAEHIAKKRGVTHIAMSDFIWGWLEDKGIKKTNITGAMFGLYLHIVYKNSPIIRWARKQIRKNRKSKVILLDSLRTYEEYISHKRKYGPRISFVAVMASPASRKERTIKRARFGDKSEKSFEMRDAEELKRGIGSLIAMADYYVDGEVAIPKMLKAMDRVYNKIVRK